MQRILRHSLLASLLAFLSLIAVAILPSVASAAPNSSVCQTSENCFLAISAPESVQAGQPFTVRASLNVYGEPSTPVPNSDSCSKVVVTLHVFDDGNNYSEFYDAKASAGVATFSISVPPESEPGSHFYSMEAQVDSETTNCRFDRGPADFIALTLPPGQPIFPCPDNVSCFQVVSGGGSAATLYADTGEFSAEFILFDPDDFPGCPGAGPLDSNGVLSFDLDPPTASKTIVFALNSNLVEKGIGQFNVCWSSPTAFTPLGGLPKVNTGLLPACKVKDPGPEVEPCVLFKTSGQHNVGYFGVHAPAGDPKGFAY